MHWRFKLDQCYKTVAFCDKQCGGRGRGGGQVVKLPCILLRRFDFESR